MTDLRTQSPELYREVWHNVACPGCGVQKCCGCGKDIRLDDGELGDEYRPHLDGSSKLDERDGGAYRDGMKSAE